MRLPDRSSGSASPRFLAPEADQGGFITAHDDPGVGAADEASPVPMNACHYSLLISV